MCVGQRECVLSDVVCWIETVCVMCGRKRENVCMFVCVCERERERERLFVWERERDSVCTFVCVCVCV